MTLQQMSLFDEPESGALPASREDFLVSPTALSGRDWLRKTLLEEVKKDIGEDVYITDTLAPGMAGMPVESIQDFFKFMDGSKIGISLLESGMMTPVKSFVGIYLVMNKEQIVSTMNCEECLSGHKFCEYCKNFASVYLEKI